MTVFGSVRSARNAIAAENPQVPLTDTTLLEMLGMEKTFSGKDVNEISALGLPAVWRAMQVSCNVPAALPLHPYREVETSRVKAVGHAAKLLDDPHPDMTPFELWQTAYFHKRGWGNAYLRKLRNPLGQIAELWPIYPNRVKVGRETEGGRKIYSIDGGREVLSDNEILHLPGLGYDGICGVSPIRAARESIGMGLAAQEYGARLFGSGALATGVLQTEQRLTQRQADQLAKRWKDKRTGLDSAHSTVVLDKGATFSQLSINPDDAQFLESRRFQVVEVCRWFGIPPFLMFETEKSTSWGTGLEQQALGWVKFDLGPELIAMEQRITKHVLKPTPVYAKYALEGLLRGDSKARAAFYKSMWEIGAFSTNDILALEERAPVEGGDVRYRPLNFGELGTTDTGSTNDAGSSDQPANQFPGAADAPVPSLRSA
ncbi:MAG TPA: phage portal protein [Nocardioidaceae bacterium]|nr:phage portal protein [Nocardioidaceae bacterium]